MSRRPIPPPSQSPSISMIMGEAMFTRAGEERYLFVKDLPNCFLPSNLRQIMGVRSQSGAGSMTSCGGGAQDRRK